VLENDEVTTRLMAVDGCPARALSAIEQAMAGA